MTILYWSVAIAGGFLSGSVMYSKILPKIFVHKDICRLSDDRNPGAFNVFSQCGAKLGAVCLLFDLAKGLVPVLLAALFLDVDSPVFAFVMVAPVCGHAVGIFNRFRGGKCISCSFGVMLGITPVTWIVLVLAALYIMFSAPIRIRSHTVRSVAVFGLFALISAVILCLRKLLCVAIGCAAVSALVIFKHFPFFGTRAENRINNRT